MRFTLVITYNLPARIRSCEDDMKSATNMRRKEEPRIAPASMIESLLQIIFI